MKKVLFIAYLYPPIANSGTRRSLEFANYLPDYGWEPIVLTVAAPSAKDCEPSLLEEVRPGTRVERAPLWSVVAAQKMANVFSRLVEHNRVAVGLEWRFRRLWQIPDECASWQPTAIRRAEEIYRQDGFDAIYASGWPWTSFLVATEVSRRTGRPSILDYRDLWKPSDVEWDRHSLLQKCLNPRLERKALHTAAAVVSTTPSFVQALEKSAGKGKVICITNGFDPDDFIRTSAPGPMAHDPVVRIVYTGVWRPGYGPEDLYRAVGHLKAAGSACLPSLKVITAGFPPGRAREYGIEDIVEEWGRVPHGQAIDLMLRSSALYLPVSKGFYEKASMPGKLFEYIGSGRPILASATPDSEVAAVLAAVGGALRILPGDVQKLADSLEKICNRDGLGLFPARLPNAVAQYTRSSLSKKLATLLDSVTQNRD
ncbi:MAG: glycosyltransferase [Candidatus Competibacteraceae bacterium]